MSKNRQTEAHLPWARDGTQPSVPGHVRAVVRAFLPRRAAHGVYFRHHCTSDGVSLPAGGLSTLRASYIGYLPQLVSAKRHCTLGCCWRATCCAHPFLAAAQIACLLQC